MNVIGKIKSLFSNNQKIYHKEYLNWKEKNRNEFKDEYNYYNLNCCPNCGIILESKILNSKKCTSCQKKINVKTNLYTKEKLLLSDKRLLEFNKDYKKKQEIDFCEKQMHNIKLLYPNKMSDFYKMKQKMQTKPNTVRDYTFSFENELQVYNEKKLYKLYKLNSKLSFQSRVLKCDEIVREFKKNELLNIYMANLVEFENKDNVLKTMLPSFIYRSLCIELLYYVHWNDRPFDEQAAISSCYSISVLIIRYLNRNNLTILDFKKDFFQFAKPFIIETINKENAWYIIEIALNDSIKQQSL